jgi:hypothetical protein
VDTTVTGKKGEHKEDFQNPKKKRHEQDEYVFGLEFHTFSNNNLRVDY